MQENPKRERRDAPYRRRGIRLRSENAGKFALRARSVEDEKMYWMAIQLSERKKVSASKEVSVKN